MASEGASPAKSSLLSSEDWWSVWIGLFLFCLSLFAFAGVDLLGWAAKTSEWLRPGEALAPVSKAYQGLPGLASVGLTYVFVLAMTTVGARFLKLDLKKFVLGFTVIFWISYLCWFLGHFAYIAATKDKLPKLGIGWSMNLTGEAGYIIALLAGLVVGNFLPGLARSLSEATKAE